MSKFEVGDRVFSWLKGIGTVVQVHDPEEDEWTGDTIAYPVIVRFNSIEDALVTYDMNGYYLGHAHHMMFPESTIVKLEEGGEV